MNSDPSKSECPRRIELLCKVDLLQAEVKRLAELVDAVTRFHVQVGECPGCGKRVQSTHRLAEKNKGLLSILKMQITGKKVVRPDEKT
jgi:hypothetical protein